MKLTHIHAEENDLITAVALSALLVLGGVVALVAVIVGGM